MRKEEGESYIYLLGGVSLLQVVKDDGLIEVVQSNQVVNHIEARVSE